MRCGGRKGRCGKRYKRRCGKLCWGGKGKVKKEMWGRVGGSVLGPHTLTHFPKPPLFLSSHPFPTHQHTSPLTPYQYTLPHIFPCLPPHPNTLPYTSHTFSHSSPHLPLHTSPLTPCTLPHLPPQFRLSDYVAKLQVPCDDATLTNETGKARQNFLQQPGI